MIFNKTAFKILKPMLPFIQGMRMAIRDGHKTQTRRIIPEKYQLCRSPEDESEWFIDVCCPYGHVGDMRYMREPLYRGPGDRAFYQDDGQEVVSLLTGKPIYWKWKTDGLTQLFMPKEAARTFKRYEFIRVERLQEISRDDAFREGIKAINPYEISPDLPPGFPAAFKDYLNAQNFFTANPIASFRSLWDSINAKRGYGWEVNPWVWVIGYGPVEEIDDLLGATARATARVASTKEV